MKHRYFLTLLFCALTTITLIHPALSSNSSGMLSNGGNATGMKMPSVADVFGGLSEEEIAEQVKIGQQFLEDLEQNGTPEQFAEFMQMLEQTVNSMSDEDFKDIQAISEMVKPLIELPNATPTAPVTSVASPSSSATESSEVDQFKQLISTITQRIDDIFQKINSSKECAESVDVKWNNKTTFNNMKRQIFVLKNDRLAQKLAKKDLTGDDKELVNTLQKFLQELTKHNDELIIEDDFGLPSNFVTEKKYLKQTQSFLDMCDNYIDIVMPKLEKFLQKNDPEALQMAKEADAKAKKASKDAIDATARKPSADARPVQKSYEPRYSPSDLSSYGDYGSYYPGSNDDYDQYPGSYGGYDDNDAKFSDKGSGSSTPGSTTPKVKTDIDKKTEDINKPKASSDAFDNIISDLNDHLSVDFTALHETKFTDFLEKDLVEKYPHYQQVIDNGIQPAIAPQTGSIGSSDQKLENDWLDSKGTFSQQGGITNYINDAKEKLKSFTKEFDPLEEVLQKLKNDLPNMSADDLKKLTKSKDFSTIESRLKHYKKAIESSKSAINAIYIENTTSPADQTNAAATSADATSGTIESQPIKDKYKLMHEDFIKSLDAAVTDNVDNLTKLIGRIKAKVKRSASKKSKK